MRAEKNQIILELPEQWLDDHPLTRLDLAQEADYLRTIGFELFTG